MQVGFWKHKYCMSDLQGILITNGIGLIMYQLCKKGFNLTTKMLLSECTNGNPLPHCAESLLHRTPQPFVQLQIYPLMEHYCGLINTRKEIPTV